MTVLETEPLHIIRTSDRNAFKKCRQAWDIGSKIRQNYEANKTPKPLAFGIAMHKALEFYYRPEFWNQARNNPEQLSVLGIGAINEFKKIQQDQIKEFLKYMKLDDLSDVDNEDYEERRTLGVGMLTNYFQWAQANDNFTVKFVEIEFEVPVLVPDHMKDWVLGNSTDSPRNFGVIPTESGHWHLTYNGIKVVYQGRLDMLVEDEYGNYWILDHKTAGSFGTTEHLDMDEQCGSYVWAMKYMLGIDVKGIIYSEMRKDVPHPPNVNKDGALSVNKNQNTTYELFHKALVDGKYDMTIPKYVEMLAYLQEQGNKFFRRIPVQRNSGELRMLGERICREAIDMLNSPQIYPNPTKWNCGGCAFKLPCYTSMEGGDTAWVLNTNFHKRESTTPELISTEGKE